MESHFQSSIHQQQECSIMVCQKNSDRYTFNTMFLCPQTSFWHTHSFFYAAVRRTQSVPHMKIQFFVFRFGCMNGKTEFRIREINIIPPNAIFRHARKCVRLCLFQSEIKLETENMQLLISILIGMCIKINTEQQHSCLENGSLV